MTLGIDAMNRKEFLALSAKAIACSHLISMTTSSEANGFHGNLPVALITGTSSGFGRIMALTLARAGYKTYASMRGVEGSNTASANDLRTTAARENLMLEVIELDVTSTEQAKEVVDTIIRNDARIDILINNAGIFLYTPMELVTRTMWELQMRTNVFGPMELAGLVLPHMRYRKAGIIINVSSFVGRATVPGIGLYAASKFTLEAATEVLHYECKPDGVDVAIIEPTAFDTDVNRNAKRIYRDVSSPSIREERTWGAEHHQGFLDQLDRNFSGQPTRDPQEVANLALRIARLPRSERVLRYPIGDQDTAILREVNTFTKGVQRNVLRNSGYGHLFRE